MAERELEALGLDQGVEQVAKQRCQTKHAQPDHGVCLAHEAKSHAQGDIAAGAAGGNDGGIVYIVVPTREEVLSC
jgi:hypothetical protein